MRAPLMTRAVVMGLAFGLFGLVMGAMVGADLGGNFAAGWEFAGTRGYEATAPIGALLGGAALAALGTFLGRPKRPS